MDHVAKFAGILCLLTYNLSGVASLDERKRTLEDEVDYCDARMQDIERETTRLQRGKKRKRDDELRDWQDKGSELIGKARRLLGQVERCRCFVMGVKVRWDVCKLAYDFKVHEQKGNKLLGEVSSDAAGGPCLGNRLPVKELVGRDASMNQLKGLLKGDEFGRIAIHGIEGIGKTFLMKHLHNWALEEFDYVFWVLSPVEFTIKSVQDALVDGVCYKFAGDDTSSERRSKELENKVSQFGRFVIFLDGAPKADFSLEEVGIPVPEKGSKCKLAITTRSSNLGCRMLDSFKEVEIPLLEEEDAYELFMQKANIGREFFYSLDGIPCSLAKWCGRLPREIENIASCMWGLDDPREWRNANALCELEGVGGRRDLVEIITSTRLLQG